MDYRFYDPDRDGKSKLEHVREMLLNVVQDKQLPFQAVLMDTTLEWETRPSNTAKRSHIKGFPKGHRVKLFRLVFSSKRTDYVATNDMA